MTSVSIEQGGTAQTTRFGLLIDYAFEVPATESRLQAAARALRENGFQVEVVDTPEDARKLVDGIELDLRVRAHPTPCHENDCQQQNDSGGSRFLILVV